jgi:hypothetical protein
MLGDAVTRLRALARGEEPPLPASSLPAVQLDLPLPAYIPESYVVDLNIRLALYQRMGQVVSPADAEALESELEDRFGSPPPATRNLLYALALKGLAREAGVQSILQEDGEFVLRQATPVANREILLRSFVSGVQVGTTQVRVSSTGNWAERLYAVTGAMAHGRPATLPEFAAEVGKGERAAFGSDAAPSPPWERPIQGAARPRLFPTSSRSPAGAAERGQRRVSRRRRGR